MSYLEYSERRDADKRHAFEVSASDLEAKFDSRDFSNTSGRTGLNGLRVSESVLLDIYSLVDLVLIALIACITKLIYIDLVRGETSSILPYLAAGIFVGAVAYFVMRSRNLYTSKWIRYESIQARIVLFALAAAFLSAMTLAYFLKVLEDFSRVWALTWFVASLIAILSWHALASRLLQRQVVQGGSCLLYTSPSPRD